MRCRQTLIPPQIRDALPAGDAFEQVMALQGEVYREITSRRTIQVALDGQSYFVKQHFGVGWAEIFKNLLTLRLPILSACTEWRAIARMRAIGIPTTPAVAYACRGLNPATMRSFVMTEDLGDIVSLETLCLDWKTNPPDARFKRRLIDAVAALAGKFHDNGLNHRDFYLCHFCLDRPRLQQGDLHLYLIDLHRVGVRRHVPRQARMKDLAGLYFSALDAGLGKRDFLRFLRGYTGDLRGSLAQQDFWRQVDARARKLFIKYHGHLPEVSFDAG